MASIGRSWPRCCWPIRPISRDSRRSCIRSSMVSSIHTTPRPMDARSTTTDGNYSNDSDQQRTVPKTNLVVSIMFFVLRGQASIRSPSTMEEILTIKPLQRTVRTFRKRAAKCLFYPPLSIFTFCPLAITLDRLVERILFRLSSDSLNGRSID